MTIKTITKVSDGHYTTKDWVERRKRKQVAVRELHRLDPSLGLMNSANKIITSNWQRFKDERCITKATIDVLLERPGEYFYSESKQTRARSKTTEELDPEAFEFFKVFLEHRNSFVRPSTFGYYWSYDIIKNQFLDWPREAYSGTSLPKMALGVIDFRNLPEVNNKDSSTINCPFFVEVMTAFSAVKKPSFDEVSSWLFISGDEKENSQVLHFIESHEVFNKYGIQHALYEPGKNERLYDAPATKSATKVFMTFLQDKNNLSQVRVPEVFHCPKTTQYTKPKNYSELEYWIYNSELRMEFYLWVVGIFCHSS